MKVAVCLSGLSRGLKYTIPTIIKYLVNPYQADVFVHTWDIDFQQGNRFGASSKNWESDKEKMSFFKDHMDTSACYFDCCIEPFEDQRWNYLKANIEGSKIVPMAYSLYKSNELKRKREKEKKIKYDLIIRTRMDSLYEEVIPPQDIDECLNDKNLLYVSTSSPDIGLKSIRNHFWFESAPFFMPFVADNFAFSSSDSMDIYCNLYPNILEVNKQYHNQKTWAHYTIFQPPPPECLLGLNIKNNNTLVKRSSFKFMRMVEINSDSATFESNYDIPPTDTNIIQAPAKKITVS